MKTSPDSATKPSSPSADSRADSTRAQILNAAEIAFAERGFAGTSMREVAGAAGTSQALLHHHFGTKAGLYEAVKARFTERYLAERPAPEAIRALDGDGIVGEVTRYFRFLQESPNLSRLVAWARLEGDSTPWGGMDEVWLEVQRWLERAKADGAVRDSVDPGLLMVMGAAAVQYWFDHRDVLCRVIGADAGDPTLDDRYLDHFVRVIIHGTAPLRR